MWLVETNKAGRSSPLNNATNVVYVFYLNNNNQHVSSELNSGYNHSKTGQSCTWDDSLPPSLLAHAFQGDISSLILIDIDDRIFCP